MGQKDHMWGKRPVPSKQNHVVTTLCFGCGNVVNATLSQRKNVDSKSRCGHVAITTLHSQPASIFKHTHIHTYTGHSPEMSTSLQESLVTYVTYCNVGYQTFLTKNEFWVQNVLKSLDLVTESPRKHTLLLR